jgi:hypothetical protein
VTSHKAEIERRMKPYEYQIADLKTIPGVVWIITWHLIAELGADMSVFPKSRSLRQMGGVEPWELRKPV